MLADLSGQLHVFQSGKIGHQIIELEHKADIVAAVGGELPGGVGGNLLIPQEHPPLGQSIHAAQDVQQSGFPRAAGAHDDAQLPLFHGKCGIPQGFNLHLAHAVDFFDPFKSDKFTHDVHPVCSPA